METTTSPSWFQKNRKWVIPVSIVIILALCLVPFLCVGGIGVSVFSLIKSSDAYQLALQEAQAHPQAIEALGEPIEPGWWLTGSINVEGSSGNADFAIPLSGPKASGTLYIVANKEAGTWNFRTLDLDLGAGERIDLLE